MEKELKSNSSALQRSCSTALSPTKIATAVKKTVKEEDRGRTREVVVFGVDEKVGQCTTTKVAEILKQLEENPHITAQLMIHLFLLGPSFASMACHACIVFLCPVID